MAADLINLAVMDVAMTKDRKTEHKTKKTRQRTTHRKKTGTARSGDHAAEITAQQIDVAQTATNGGATISEAAKGGAARPRRKRPTTRRSRAAGSKGATPIAHAETIPVTGEAPSVSAADEIATISLIADMAETARTIVPAETPAAPPVGPAIAEQPPRRRSRRGRRRRRDRSEAGDAVSAQPSTTTPTEGGSLPFAAPQVEITAGAAERASDEAIVTPEARQLPAPGDGRGVAPSAPGVPARRDEPRRRRRGRRGRGGAGGNGDNRAVIAERGSVAITPPAETATSAPVRLSLVPPEERSEFDVELEDTVSELDFDDEGGVELDALEPGEEAEVEESPAAPTGTRQMMINVSAGTECRIAILHEGRLEEFFIERESTQSHVGNIYKGRITNVEPSIQAAFIDFGLEKNGFLHISDVQPQYFPNHSGEPEDVGRKIPRHHRPPIQKCFRRGQEVIVQITKEGVGTKGPTLTSYLSIPGRFLVMMPGMSRHGVSRKIEDDAQRRQMRDLLAQLDLPQDMGFILRTAGLGRTKRELQRDLNYLMRLWKTVVERIKRLPGPAELYRESDLVTRTIRDVYAADFDRIVVDDAVVAKKVREFLHIAMPRTKTSVESYAEREPIFHRFGIEAELDRINMRHVPLPSGGSLVIDSTEAMVAIDVNSGRFRSPADAEETALRINVEAAEEIARQLRLRDLGGLIVCDFIDMRHDRNKRKVEQSLRDALKKHKERARILRMSAFGLIEMTRQRQGPSLRRNLYTDCPHCRGSGQVKQPESVMLDAMRMIQLAAHNEQVQRIVLNLSSDPAFRLLNQKRSVISQIESETSKSIVIRGDADFSSDYLEIACEDSRGRPVVIAAPPAPPTAQLPTRSDSRGNAGKPR